MPGVAVGLVIALALVRMFSEDFGLPLSKMESLSYVVAAAIAIFVALVASFVPAHRAASVEPMVAMRTE